MRSLTVPVSDAGNTVFRVLFSERCVPGGTVAARRVRFARFTAAPRRPAAGPLFFLKEKKSVGCETPPVACGKPAFFRFSIGGSETVHNCAGSHSGRYQVPHISTALGSGVVMHGRPVGWPFVLFAGEYNPQRLWSGPALSRSCPHEHVAPVGRSGAVPELSIGRGYEGARGGAVCRPLSLCDSSHGLGLQGAAKCAAEETGAVPVSGAGYLAETNTPFLWRRPAGRVSPRRAARVAVLGLAVLVAGTLTSCTTLAPVVRCVPDSAVLPCK